MALHHDNTKYLDADNDIAEKVRQINEDPNRFVSIRDRKDVCDASLETIKMLAFGRYQNIYKGIPLLKGALDLEIYRHILWDLKPKTIIEFGTYKGASAVWFADQLKNIGIGGKIYTVDIDPELLDPLAKDYPNVELISGDLSKVQDVFPESFLKGLPRPWLIAEDAHINLSEIMGYFHKFIQPGDYLIFEDTNPKYAKITGMGFVYEEYEEFGPYKMNDVRSTVENYDDFYKVDTKYCDMFRCNNSCFMNSIFKRIK